MKGKLFSIGYSGFGNNAEKLIGEMRCYIGEKTVVIDVRSMPYSMYYSEFNKDYFENALKQSGLFYRNYSEEFGALQTDQVLNSDGYLDFEAYSKTDKFQKGISKVKASLGQGWDVVLMCAEKEPENCHRAVLISHEFAKQGFNVTHILPGGVTKTQEDIDEELLNKLDFIDQNDNPEIDDLTKAYRKQNLLIGKALIKRKTK